MFQMYITVLCNMGGVRVEKEGIIMITLLLNISTGSKLWLIITDIFFIPAEESGGKNC